MHLTVDVSGDRQLSRHLARESSALNCRSQTLTVELSGELSGDLSGALSGGLVKNINCRCSKWRLKWRAS